MEEWEVAPGRIREVAVADAESEFYPFCHYICLVALPERLGPNLC
jgi:hypothetical protein